MLKFLSEFAPLVAFFIGYFYGGDIQTATLYMLVTSVTCVSLCYFIEKKISRSSLISSAVLLVFASIGLITGNPVFIKVKPTILYVIFGCAFLVSAAKDRPLMKYMLDHFIQLEGKIWNVLSYRAGGFFLFMALLNEIVWRNCTEATWVKFKIFGAIPTTIVFIVLQMPFILKHKLPDDKDTDTTLPK